MFAIVKRYPVKSVIRLVMPCKVFYCYVFFLNEDLLLIVSLTLYAHKEPTNYRC